MSYCIWKFISVLPLGINDRDMGLNLINQINQLHFWAYPNTTDETSRPRTVYHSGAPEFTPVFSGVRVTRSLVLCVCFVDRCLSFFFLCPSI